MSSSSFNGAKAPSGMCYPAPDSELENEMPREAGGPSNINYCFLPIGRHSALEQSGRGGFGGGEERVDHLAEVQTVR